MGKKRKGTKLSIVGAGAVGTSLAYATLINGLASEVALQDINEKKVKAEALDLVLGASFMPPVKITGSSDVAVTAGSDIVVITAGAKQQPGETRMDLAGKTVELMKKIVPGIVEQSPDAVLMLVTNPVDVITQAALKISGLPDGQVIGSGTVLDLSRLRWLIAGECDVAISSVHAVICGEHGDSEVPMWSTASIGGVPLLEWEEQTGKLGRERRDVITRQTIDAAYEVIGQGRDQLRHRARGQPHHRGDPARRARRPSRGLQAAWLARHLRRVHVGAERRRPPRRAAHAGAVGQRDGAAGPAGQRRSHPRGRGQPRLLSSVGTSHPGDPAIRRPPRRGWVTSEVRHRPANGASPGPQPPEEQSPRIAYPHPLGVGSGAGDTPVRAEM